MITADAIAALFPGPVEVETGPILALPREVLRPDEAALISAAAVDKRVHEVTTGRTYARRALERLGLTSVSIRAADNRAPLWPEGIAGSITHTKKVCCVVVGRRHEIGHIGIDVEEGGALPAGVEASVLTAAEQEIVARMPDPALAGLLWFSAKEAFYKAQSPITGVFLGFHEVEIAPGGHFHATQPSALRLRLLRAAGPLPLGYEAEIRVLRDAERVVTACTLPVPGPIPKST